MEVVLSIGVVGAEVDTCGVSLLILITRKVDKRRYNAEVL